MTDVSTTPRKRFSPRKRLQIWEASCGICVICGGKIDGARERWIVEHILALELGGTNDDDNLGPAHECCRREKDKDDHHRAAQAKRAKQRHLGIRKPSTLKSRGFRKADPQRSATRPLEKWRGFTT